MKFEILPPPCRLSSHVHYFWKADVSGKASQNVLIRSFADSSMGIIFQHHHGQSSIFNEHTQRHIPMGFVYGMTTLPMVSHSWASFSAVGVALPPFALKEFFGINADNFTNQLLPLDDIGFGEFSKAMLQTSDSCQQLSLLCSFLDKRMLALRQPDYVIRHALDRIQTRRGQLQVCELYNEANLSSRQFERRFLSHTGVSPRHFIQVSRFQEFIQRIRSGDCRPLSQHAHDLGYADQSHFIRVIKRFSRCHRISFLVNMFQLTQGF